jgi:hypothetical protein
VFLIRHNKYACRTGGYPVLGYSRAFGLVTAFALVVISSGCSPEELPMAPSSLTAGIVLYEHANFLGNSAHLTADVADLRDFKGPCFDGNDASNRNWNDCVSSVRVAPGWRATLYRGPNYHDDSLDIVEDVANLQLILQHDCPQGGLNDCVSSVRVRQE